MFHSFLYTAGQLARWSAHLMCTQVMETIQAAGHLEPEEIKSFWRYGNADQDPFLYTSVIELFSLFLSLQLEFSQELFIKNISIYETYNSGFVANISVWNSQTQTYQFVYQGEAEALTYSRIFSPQIDVRLHMWYKFHSQLWYVVSATQSIYVWCLTMFLLQCHLEKRTLRIFGGKDSRFYTQLISTL